MKKFIIILTCMVLFTVCNQNTQESLSALPLPESDGGPFGIDININMSTIDNYLNRPDVAYFDLRMFYDPANFMDIGQIPRITRTLPGYIHVPFPFIGTLASMPVSNSYNADSLFKIVWGENREILEMTPNYLESEIILNEIFPKDKVIFLMCGGGGYNSMLKSLLISKGWDETLIYNTGGNWHYQGINSVDMTIDLEDIDGFPLIATWRANYIHINFDRLTPIRQ